MSSHVSAGMQLFMQRRSVFTTEEGVSRGLSFKPRSDDVFVVTPPKCGTTWMQQILHQLRSGGDMSFDDISDVVPYIEFAYDTEVDLEAEHKYQPRCYKTHAWYPWCPKGASKYIVIYREPCASFYSYFNFLKGWIFQPGEVLLHEFVKDYLLALGLPKKKMERASYFVHLLSWWEHRNDLNVLFLFFEDMKDDLESAVRKVAAFIGIQDDERIREAVKMSSFEYMKENERKFSEVRLARCRNKSCGIPDDVVASKVVTGSATKGRELMDDKTKEIIQAKWLEVVEKQTGFQDYNELRRAFKMEQMNRN
ncbi:sulfotransferase domain-containing [Paramuricea clavata]|uniref:Sulfotransferase domain-containing n=1 Tax=Paramuricea clavata TaxID=317549 RepID=A0A6S7GP47_PARCT|nr:sulfotransferase domain-containing [Paramuricea clavata]